jgi:hypothetical protein
VGCKADTCLYSINRLWLVNDPQKEEVSEEEQHAAVGDLIYWGNYTVIVIGLSGMLQTKIYVLFKNYM